jgi:hypothetical protein
MKIEERLNQIYTNLDSITEKHIEDYNRNPSTKQVGDFMRFIIDNMGDAMVSPNLDEGANEKDFYMGAQRIFINSVLKFKDKTGATI